ncbi:hypothetical protein [Streptomyces zaehneri]|nr:hypothetical protein [Streptomyces sp. DSM 40713]
MNSSIEHSVGVSRRSVLSVPEVLAAAHACPREFVYTLPSDHRPGKGN